MSDSNHAFDPYFLQQLQSRAELAAEWLTGIAQVQTVKLQAKEKHIGFPYADWRGAIRGEYRVSTGQWGFFCPYWHSSQAVKAMVQLSRVSADPRWLESARAAGEFLLRHRISDPASPDYGLLLAYEDAPSAVNTSAILESIDGLFLLSDETGEAGYEDAAIAALRWVARRVYRKGEGVFHDLYDPVAQRLCALSEYVEVSHSDYCVATAVEKPRPLLDDAVFLKGYQRTGDALFRRIALETAETLLRTERPAGNWITYAPCDEKQGLFHPRHAYWWGSPMIEVWKETGDDKFLQAALRSADWYKKALRRDGGLIRNTATDYNTDSFGHATSGSACAAIFFLRLAAECGDDRHLALARKTLAYGMDMQFLTPQDANLKGAILEKILPPDGTDGSPFHIRDLGTIFFIQAAAQALHYFAKPADSTGRSCSAK